MHVHSAESERFGSKPPQATHQQQHQHQQQPGVEIITISRQLQQQTPLGSQQTVVREQYCSCAPRTRNEQVMLVVIIVMAFCIVGLVAALGAVTKATCDPRATGWHSALL